MEEEVNQLSGPVTAQDCEFMREALKLAHVALLEREVPVGCVITRRGQIVATGMNKPNQTKDATTHAEFVAIDALVTSENDSYIFDECDLYVTVEPCVMCAAALLTLGTRRVSRFIQRRSQRESETDARFNVRRFSTRLLWLLESALWRLRLGARALRQGEVVRRALSLSAFFALLCCGR